MTSTYALRLAVPLVALALGCDRTTTDVAARFSPADSVRLAETSTVFVARAAAFHPAADGAFAISDAGRNAVLEFSSSGTFVREYGRRGSGPGEFGSIGSTLLITRDNVVADDAARRKLLVFSRTDGRLLGEVPMVGRLGESRLDQNMFVLSLWDNASGVAGALVAGPNAAALLALDTLRATLTELPPSYRRSGALAGIYGLYHATQWSDSVAAVFAGDSGIRLYRRGERSGVERAVPVARRRGIPRNFVAMLEDPAVPFPDKFEAASGALHVGRHSSGEFIVVHYDSELQWQAIHAKLWASLISPAGLARCIDREIPASGDVRALVHFTRDTLFVLDQRVEGQHLSTVVRKFAVDVSRC
jgi:hypothetical protein